MAEMEARTPKDVFLLDVDYKGPAKVALDDSCLKVTDVEKAKERYPWRLIEELEERLELERSNHPEHVPDIFANWELVKVDVDINGYADCLCGKKDIRNVYHLKKRIDGEEFAEIAIGSKCVELFEKGRAEEADDALERLCCSPLRAVYDGDQAGRRHLFRVYTQDLPFEEKVLDYLKTLFYYLFVEWGEKESFLEVRLERSVCSADLTEGEEYDLSLTTDKYYRDYGAGIDLQVYRADLVPPQEEGPGGEGGQGGSDDEDMD